MVDRKMAQKRSEDRIYQSGWNNRICGSGWNNNNITIIDPFDYA